MEIEACYSSSTVQVEFSSHSVQTWKMQVHTPHRQHARLKHVHISKFITWNLQHTHHKTLAICIVPACFKSIVIFPAHKKPIITNLNDHRPAALTSISFSVKTSDYKNKKRPDTETVSSPKLNNSVEKLH